MDVVKVPLHAVAAYCVFPMLRSAFARLDTTVPLAHLVQCSALLDTYVQKGPAPRRYVLADTSAQRDPTQ